MKIILKINKKENKILRLKFNKKKNKALILKIQTKRKKLLYHHQIKQILIMKFKLLKKKRN